MVFCMKNNLLRVEEMSRMLLGKVKKSNLENIFLRSRDFLFH